jgi:hypothetical protein
MKSLHAFLWLTIVTLATAHAGTIVSVTGPTTHLDTGLPGDNVSIGSGTQLVGVEWTATQSYQSATIEALLLCVTCQFGSSPHTIDAYLSSAVGPATTAGQVIATSSVLQQFDASQTCTSNAGTFSSCAWITLFSDLNLAPGQYFLVLSGPAAFENEGWVGTNAPTTNTALGVTTDNLAYIANALNGSPNYAFPSGSTFKTFSGYNSQFQVNDSVPEPSTFLLLAGGILALTMTRIKRRQSHLG